MLDDSARNVRSRSRAMACRTVCRRRRTRRRNSAPRVVVGDLVDPSSRALARPRRRAASRPGGRPNNREYWIDAGDQRCAAIDATSARRNHRQYGFHRRAQRVRLGRVLQRVEVRGRGHLGGAGTRSESLRDTSPPCRTQWIPHGLGALGNRRQASDFGLRRNVIASPGRAGSHISHPSGRQSEEGHRSDLPRCRPRRAQPGYRRRAPCSGAVPRPPKRYP